jgi:hypothetical protein
VPPSVGNNEWKPDLIPNHRVIFLIMQYPVRPLEEVRLSETSETLVRAGAEEDLKALTATYNHYIRESPATFDTELFTPDERRDWLFSHLSHRAVLTFSRRPIPPDGCAAEPPVRARAGTRRNLRPHPAKFWTSRRAVSLVGTYHEEGRKFGRYYGVQRWEKAIGP